MKILRYLHDLQPKAGPVQTASVPGGPEFRVLGDVRPANHVCFRSARSGQDYFVWPLDTEQARSFLGFELFWQPVLCRNGSAASMPVHAML